MTVANTLARRRRIRHERVHDARAIHVQPVLHVFRQQHRAVAQAGRHNDLGVPPLG